MRSILLSLMMGLSAPAIGAEMIVRLDCGGCSPESLGYKTIKTFPLDDSLFVVESDETKSFLLDNAVVYATPNRKIQIDPIVEIDAVLRNDPRHYGRSVTGSDTVNDLGIIGSEEIVVAVIDTGVDYNHNDLRSNMWRNSGELGLDDDGNLKSTNGIDDDGNGYVDDVFGIDSVNGDSDPIDDHDHGTHCAGIVAGDSNIGHAPGVRIMALKFLSAGGSGSTAGAVEAIQYAVAMGAHILSNSWGGGPFDDALNDAITLAEQANILVTAAAGNSSSDNDARPHFPSSYEQTNLIAVASTDRNDRRSFFSSFGETSVDIGAPGSQILSTTRNNGHKVFSGTSMATPAVSGIAALLLTANPTLKPSEIRQILIDTVEPIDLEVVSQGRVNTFDAVLEALQRR